MRTKTGARVFTYQQLSSTDLNKRANNEPPYFSQILHHRSSNIYAILM